jgi:response regulator of citrate/malate metabolism
VLAKIIGDVGHQAAKCLILADGLEEVCAHPNEFILLDVQLPDGNGLSAIGKIKEAPSSPEVIILTIPPVRNPRSGGVRGTILKPDQDSRRLVSPSARLKFPHPILFWQIASFCGIS